MNSYAIKFFGSKNRKEQIKQVKMTIDAESEANIEFILRNKYGYAVINGLKVRQVA